MVREDLITSAVSYKPVAHSSVTVHVLTDPGLVYVAAIITLTCFFLT